MRENLKSANHHRRHAELILPKEWTPIIRQILHTIAFRNTGCPAIAPLAPDSVQDWRLDAYQLSKAAEEIEWKDEQIVQAIRWVFQTTHQVRHQCLPSSQ